MKACVIHGKHDLHIEDRPVPAPSATQVVVRFEAGGICGSDLHYYNHGKVGAFEVREPMILGHEVAGKVVEVGEDVTHVKVGDRVAVNPARTCGVCDYCRAGHANLCPEVLYYGSAARFPHVGGAFAELFLAEERQCVSLGTELSYRKAACAEPLAVAIHAVRRGGEVLGKRVLITGAGPIGLLCLMVARLEGAKEIVITDQMDEPLAVARTLGANHICNSAEKNNPLEELGIKDPVFDIAIEAAGALPALNLCMAWVRPRGRVVQLGLLPPKCNESLSLSCLASREIELVGTFRFHEEYEQAVHLLQSGRLDPSPILTAQVPIQQAEFAFELASDRRKALKVTLVP
jgi:L-idonate 5-dehydrogenase